MWSLRRRAIACVLRGRTMVCSWTWRPVVALRGHGGTFAPNGAGRQGAEPVRLHLVPLGRGAVYGAAQVVNVDTAGPIATGQHNHQLNGSAGGGQLLAHDIFSPGQDRARRAVLTWRPLTADGKLSPP